MTALSNRLLKIFGIANSVSMFFIALLAVSIIIVPSFDVSHTPPRFTKSTMPKIEINNFTAFEVTQDALISKLTAKNGKQFENENKATIEELSDIVVERNSDAFDTLSAKSARKIGDNIYFDNGVKNLRDGYEMYSRIATYNLQSKALNGKDDFYIKSKFEDIKGENISYESGIIKAQNITAKIKLESHK